MAINFDKALGSLPENLSVFGQRSSLLAANIANADTPGFKARDIDFQSMLAKASGSQIAMSATHSGHIGSADTGIGAMDMLYRVPTQTSLDGNTVNNQVEQAEFTENAIRYQSTLTFLSGKFSGLKLAIKGE